MKLEVEVSSLQQRLTVIANGLDAIMVCGKDNVRTMAGVMQVLDEVRYDLVALVREANIKAAEEQKKCADDGASE